MIWARACSNTNFPTFKIPKNAKKIKRDRPTDRRTDRPTRWLIGRVTRNKKTKMWKKSRFNAINVMRTSLIVHALLLKAYKNTRCLRKCVNTWLRVWVSTRVRMWVSTRLCMGIQFAYLQTKLGETNSRALMFDLCRNIFFITPRNQFELWLTPDKPISLPFISGTTAENCSAEILLEKMQQQQWQQQSNLPTFLLPLLVLYLFRSFSSSSYGRYEEPF